MSGLTLDQTQQVHHIACMAVLAMCARGVAGAEFDSSPEVGALRLVVHRSIGAEQPSVDVEFLNEQNIPLGGMSL